MSSELAPGRNLVLIGMPGSGKTVVGRLLAERLGRPFVDTDEVVEAELPQSEGTRAFRYLEREAVRGVSALRGQVVAVGAGAVTDPANVTALRATGDLVLLDASDAELAARLATCENRERLWDAPEPRTGLAAMRSRREGAYRSAATHTVDTSGRTPEEVAGAVLAWARTKPGLLSRDERDL
jgi:shikimate kinase